MAASLERTKEDERQLVAFRIAATCILFKRRQEAVNFYHVELTP